MNYSGDNFNMNLKNQHIRPLQSHNISSQIHIVLRNILQIRPQIVLYIHSSYSIISHRQQCMNKFYTEFKILCFGIHKEKGNK